MSLSLTLDVAISLIFVFVLAALLASTVNELFAGILKLRGVYLTKGIEAITSLGKGNEFKWGGLPGWVYAHFWQSKPTVSAPIDNVAIAAMNAGETAARAPGATATTVAKAARGVPNFATLGTYLDQAINAAVNMQGATAENVMKVIHPIGGIADLQSHPLMVGTPSSLPSYVPARDFAAALLDQLIDSSKADLFAQAKNTINNLPDGDLKTTLLAFIEAGANDIDTFRKRIENWFDDAMERVSGIYTRFSQYVLLALGLVIAVGMNIDSVHLTKTLWDQPTLSNAISNGAAQYVSANKENIFGCKENRPPGDATGQNTATEAKACQKIDLKAIQDVIDQQKLPIGRNGANFFGCPYVTQGGHSVPSAVCADAAWEFWTVLGWLVTAFAISLGAQFWFGLLTQLINLRAAGDRPERANKTT